MYPHLADDGTYIDGLYVLFSGETIREPTYNFSSGGTSGFTSKREPLAHHLIRNKPFGSVKYSNWKGPYLASDKYDQWGHSYLITVIGYSHCVKNYSWPYVWVISAGPDGVLETSSYIGNSGVLVGDDIGFLIYTGSTQPPCEPE